MAASSANLRRLETSPNTDFSELEPGGDPFTHAASGSGTLGDTGLAGSLRPNELTLSNKQRRLPDYKPVSVSPKIGAAVIPLGRRLLPGSSNLPGSRNGAGRSCSPIWSCSAWGLPCQRPLPEPRCALTAPFHPYPAGKAPNLAVLFSVALSVKLALSESPRPLAGMLPYGDRTFLPNVTLRFQRATTCPASPNPYCQKHMGCVMNH